MIAQPYRRGLSACRRAEPAVAAGFTAPKLIGIAHLMWRPALVSVAIVSAATLCSTPAQADPVDSSTTSVLNSVGIGNNGALSTAIAQVGQSICPLLVQPGSSVASSAIQASGNGGLAPTIGGAVAGMVIQSQCPNAMTQLANGNFAPLMQLLGMAGINTPSSPFGLPGTAAISPLIAAPSVATSPLQLPGLS